MINLHEVVQFVLYLVVFGLVFWLLWWLIDYIGLPEPFAKVARVILAVLAVFCLINLLLGIVGQPLVSFR